MDGAFGVSRCKLFPLEWISNEVLLYSPGSSIRSPGIDQDGKNTKKKVCVCVCVCVCVKLSRFAAQQKWAQYYTSTLFS